VPKTSTLKPQAERAFDRDLDEVGGAFGRLAGATERVGAADVEVTQDHVAQAVGAASVAQHDLGHQLRGAIGRRRLRGIVFTHRRAVGIAVDRAVEEKMKWRTRPLKARSSARASSPYCCGNSRLDREPSPGRRGEMDKWITASTWYSTINFKSS